MPDHDTRLLVTPDRDAADIAAESVAELGYSTEVPRVVREALAGEDDAEDAQWLVVLDAPSNGWSTRTLAALETMASGHGGWLETAH